MSVDISMITNGCASSGRPVVTMTRGEPLAISVVIDPTTGTDAAKAAKAALVTKLTGATWLAQIRLTPGAATVTATFTKSESTTDGVLTVLFSLADSSALLANGLYYFDFQVTSGAASGLTICSGATIVVTSDVSRAS